MIVKRLKDFVSYLATPGPGPWSNPAHEKPR